MKNLIFLFGLLLFISCSSDIKNLNDYTFEGSKSWSKTVGGSDEDHVKSAIPSIDGGFFTIGYTKSNDGDISQKANMMEDVWLCKYNADGEIVWSKTYGGSMDEYGYSMLENLDGTLVVAGYSMSSNGDVPSNLGMHDFYIFKTDAHGELIWNKSYGFTSHDHAHKIIKTDDGGYFVAGFIDYSGVAKGVSTLHGVGEFYGLKLDANGNKLWDGYFGGTQNDRVFDVAEALDGGLVMVGYSESEDFDITDSKGSYDFWVVKLSKVGNVVWKKSFGGSGIDQAYGIAKTNQNTFIITGVSNSDDLDIRQNLGSSDVWVIHINDDGNLIWSKNYGGSQFDSSNSIQKLKSGHFLISGHTRSNDGLFTENKGENDFFGLIINENGDVIWQHTFGGSAIDVGVQAIELQNRSIVLVGDTQSSDFDAEDAKGMTDVLIVKVDH